MQLPEPDFALAARLFDILDRNTRDVKGFSRASYGAGEQFAELLLLLLGPHARDRRGGEARAADRETDAGATPCDRNGRAISSGKRRNIRPHVG